MDLSSFEEFRQYSLPLLFFSGTAILYVGSRLLRPLIEIGYPIAKTCYITNRPAPNGIPDEQYDLHRYAELGDLSKYWVCYGVFHLAEYVADPFLAYIVPFYSHSKLLIAIILQCRWNGRQVSVMIYDRYLGKAGARVYEISQDVYSMLEEHLRSEFQNIMARSAVRVTMTRASLSSQFADFIRVRIRNFKNE